MKELQVNEVTFAPDGLLIKFMLPEEATDLMVTQREVFLQLGGMAKHSDQIEYWIGEVMGDVRELAWQIVKEQKAS